MSRSRLRLRAEGGLPSSPAAPEHVGREQAWPPHPLSLSMWGGSRPALLTYSTPACWAETSQPS
eukprot:363017-Chlamydomonas_euryale.AAC.2